MCSGCLDYNREQNNDVGLGEAWIQQGTQIRHSNSISKLHDMLKGHAAYSAGLIKEVGSEQGLAQGEGASQVDSGKSTPCRGNS